MLYNHNHSIGLDDDDDDDDCNLEQFHVSISSEGRCSDLSQLRIFSNYPAKSREMSPDTSPTRP